MFKLRFFIVFVLTVLCFVDQFNSEEVEEESAGSDGKPEKPLGHELPNFIGGPKDKHEYMKKLHEECEKNHYLWLTNERNITFPTCTYYCLSKTESEPPKEVRIPQGMLCNYNTICPASGECPKPPATIPSC
uniref:Putative secreted salivary gland peptide n=1 Tax=Ixodes scapularis TaxID=6945 RepID=Q5Q997_IXOSC|nr:putative secreted salivary gland peptide [Ixodes scapularis]